MSIFSICVNIFGDNDDLELLINWFFFFFDKAFISCYWKPKCWYGNIRGKKKLDAILLYGYLDIKNYWNKIYLKNEIKRFYRDN